MLRVVLLNLTWGLGRNALRSLVAGGLRRLTRANGADLPDALSG
jgi:hypothetical protein